MNIISDVESLIGCIWEEPLFSEITSKKMDVSIYTNLSMEIPDKFIIIEEVFPKVEIGEIWTNYEAYLGEHQIFPFLGTLGEAVICIGYGEVNKGKIYYFDFDFGCFELGGEGLKEFLGKLIKA